MDKFTKNQSIGLIIGSIVLLTSIISIVVINNNIKNQINEALEDLENSNDSLEELNFSNLNFNFLSKSGAINDLEGELFFSFRAEDIIGDNDSRTYYKEDLETELKLWNIYHKNSEKTSPISGSYAYYFCWHSQNIYIHIKT